MSTTIGKSYVKKKITSDKKDVKVTNKDSKNADLEANKDLNK